MTDPDFNNFYITSYFKTIDTRRRNKGKQTLLPLRPYERNAVVDSTDFKMISVEFEKLFLHFVTTLLHIAIATLIILTDWLLTFTLILIEQNGKIDFTQVGEFTIDIEVIGTSSFAEFLRNILNNFEVNNHVTTFFSTEPCLPYPSVLNPR